MEIESQPTAGSPGAAFRFHDRALLLHFYKWLFWDRLIAALPRSLRPNTITIIGETCAVASAVTAWFAAQGTPVLYLVSALLLFFYVTGDNIDGPHARRTGQTSALGEFLDHGLDGLASCAGLLTSAFALRMDGPWLAGAAVLAGLSFYATFWAQFRTGLLVTPQLSAMEGVTGAALFLIVVFSLGEPAWLRFSPGTWNPALVIVGALGLSYVVAILLPLVRAARGGTSLLELVPVTAVTVVIGLGAFGPVSTLLPVIAMSLVIAELVCRMILHRHAGDTRATLRPAHLVLVAPWPAVALGVGPAEALAWGGTGLALVSYAWTFRRGWVELTRPSPPAA